MTAAVCCLLCATGDHRTTTAGTYIWVLLAVCAEWSDVWGLPFIRPFACASHLDLCLISCILFYPPVKRCLLYSVSSSSTTTTAPRTYEVPEGRVVASSRECVFVYTTRLSMHFRSSSKQLYSQAVQQYNRTVRVVTMQQYYHRRTTYVVLTLYS